VSGWLVAAYPWLKAGHVISVIAWMAGLLYLPRLYVYHAAALPGGDRSETFKIMERRLLRGIMMPALVATYAFGLALAATPGAVDWRMGWPWVKAALVLGLTGFHYLLARWRQAFAGDRNVHSAGFFRAVNELPTVAMIVIVILVVVKPF
jgi:putative membrane protein